MLGTHGSVAASLWFCQPSVQGKSILKKGAHRKHKRESINTNQQVAKTDHEECLSLVIESRSDPRTVKPCGQVPERQKGDPIVVVNQLVVTIKP